MEVSYFIAFSAGLLTFLSPCILPLLPVYLAFFSGISLSESTKQGLNRKLIFNVLAFIIGFTLIFVLLGASASLLGQFLFRYSTIIIRVSSGFIILLGLFMMGILKLNWFMRTFKFESGSDKSTILGAFLFGIVFSLGWTPCTGPVLASILIMAGSKASIMKGMLLLGVYSMGMAVPFLLSAVLWGNLVGQVKRLQKWTGWFEKIAGLCLILVGLWMVFKGGL